MPLLPDTALSGFWPDQAIRSVTRWVQGLIGHTDFSPEETLAEAANVDPRLVPRVPMSAENIDVHLLSELGKLGLKRGKLITEASHPELMQAWKTMSARAGLKKAPQLILAESDAANALAVTPEEVVVTTGLFKLLDAREVTAVLGHEFGHEKSNHQRPRMLATALLGGAGVILGDRFARQGGVGALLQKWVKGDGKVKQFLNWKFGAEARPSSVLGSLIYMAIGGGIGSVLANQLTVRPTELDADAKSVAISGDPQALISALSKLDAARPTNSPGRLLSYLQSGYPSTKTRIDRLRSMVAHAPAEPLLASAELPAALSGHPGYQVQQVAADARLVETPGAAIALH